MMKRRVKTKTVRIDVTDEIMKKTFNYHKF